LLPRLNKCKNGFNWVKLMIEKPAILWIDY